MILAAIYFIIRLRHRDFFSRSRRRSSRSRAAFWPRHRKQKSEPYHESPPIYSRQQEPSGLSYPTEVKAVSLQREMEAFFSPSTPPTLVTPSRTTALSGADPKQQIVSQEPLRPQTGTFYHAPQEESPMSTSDLNKILI